VQITLSSPTINNHSHPYPKRMGIYIRRSYVKQTSPLPSTRDETNTTMSSARHNASTSAAVGIPTLKNPRAQDCLAV